MTMADVWRFVQDASAFIILVGAPLLSWALWSLRAAYVKHVDCDAHRKEIAAGQGSLSAHQGGTDQRYKMLEKSIRDLPTSADIAGMRLLIERLSGDIRVLETGMKGQRDILTRLEGQVGRIDGYLKGDLK